MMDEHSSDDEPDFGSEPVVVPPQAKPVTTTPQRAAPDNTTRVNQRAQTTGVRPPASGGVRAPGSTATRPPPGAVRPTGQSRPRAPGPASTNQNAGNHTLERSAAISTRGRGASASARGRGGIRPAANTQPARQPSLNPAPLQETGPVAPKTGDSGEPDLVASMWGMWSSASKAVSEAVHTAQESEAYKDAIKNINQGASKAFAVANEGLEKVKTVFDPYNGLDLEELSVLVASMNPKYLIAVQEALSTVMPLSSMDVSGMDIDVGSAAQVVGFSSGQAAAENALVGLRLQSGANKTRENGVIVISIQNFITQIGANWFDMAVVILQDDNRDISLVTYSQTVRVPIEFVEAARKGSETYKHRNTGYERTIGECVHERFPKVPADDWHGHFNNNQMDTVQLIENSVVGILGEYLIELRTRETIEQEQ